MSLNVRSRTPSVPVVSVAGAVIKPRVARGTQPPVGREPSKTVYSFVTDGKIWFTHAKPGHSGPAVYRPQKKGKPRYGWAGLRAPVVPKAATPVQDPPPMAVAKLKEVEQVCEATDSAMINLIGPH